MLLLFFLSLSCPRDDRRDGGEKPRDARADEYTYLALSYGLVGADDVYSSALVFLSSRDQEDRYCSDIRLMRTWRQSLVVFGVFYARLAVFIIIRDKLFSFVLWV